MSSIHIYTPSASPRPAPVSEVPCDLSGQVAAKLISRWRGLIWCTVQMGPEGNRGYVLTPRRQALLLAQIAIDLDWTLRVSSEGTSLYLGF